MDLELSVNDKEVKLAIDSNTPLLWVLREQLSLTGTKYSCGIAQCGACTVHLDGKPVRACVTPVSVAVGKRITTVEGLGTQDKPHPVQLAWIDIGVPQCGYCQSGQIMSAAALLAEKPNPTDSDIDAAMAGNLCRCGTYLRIRKAIHTAAALMAKKGRRMSAVPVTRRHFLKVSAAAGGGLLIGFHIPQALAATVQPKPWTTPPQGAEINAWLAIDAEGNVTIRVPHTEMGQGALTAVSMMIAEELDVDWTRVRAVFADPNRHLRNGNEYKSMNTSGSAVVRRQHPHIMQAGASARERLKEAAARAWGIDRGQVEAKLGALKAGTHTGTYAEFATAAAAVTLVEEPAIKKPGDWWLLGKPQKRLDVDVKSNGSAVYAIDVQVPNMVYAAVKACPVPWGTLKRYDDSATKGRPGILAVVALKSVPGQTDNSDMQDAVAVVADSWWRAKNTLEEITIEWDYGPYANSGTASQLALARQRLEKPGELVSEESEGALWLGESREVTAEYHRPWETHARMEPINATVSVTPVRVDVWSPTQDQSTALQLAADQAGANSGTSSCTPSSSAGVSAATAEAPRPSRARPRSFRSSSSVP